MPPVACPLRELQVVEDEWTDLLSCCAEQPMPPGESELKAKHIGREGKSVKIELDGDSLSLDDLAAIVSGAKGAVLARSARERMARAREVVTEAVAAGQEVYGLTTGVAERKRIRLKNDDQQRFNRLLIPGHRVSQGPLASAPVVRAAMTCLANNLAKGFAGVRPELGELVLEAVAEGFVPPVRSLGSVGEADLGPLADLAHGLLERYGFVLEEGEALAMIDTNAFSTGWSALSLLKAERLLDSADAAAALDLEAFAANMSPWHDVVIASRPFPGIATTISNVRQFLDGSALWEKGRARHLQDPLTFRCLPQVHGAARDALSYARRTVETELNAFQGNPAVVANERVMISVGNFDPVAMAAAVDLARIALAPVVTSATERTVKLLQQPTSGLPAGLAEAPELGEDALAEFAVASLSFAAEARLLAQPVSFELASASKAEGIEDRMTMAPLSARRLSEMVALTARVISVELAVAAQAVDLRRRGPLGRGTAAVYSLVRSHVPFTGRGMPPPPDLEPLTQVVERGELAISVVMSVESVDGQSGCGKASLDEAGAATGSFSCRAR
jgi:histidine ammonia-lyase